MTDLASSTRAILSGPARTTDNLPRQTRPGLQRPGPEPVSSLRQNKMPMFSEDDMARQDSHDLDSQRPGSSPIPIQTPPGAGRWNSRRLSEESIRTELCEGPLLDSPPRPETPPEAVSRAVSDRAELIERLKRGESPTWVPNRHVCLLSSPNESYD